MIRNYEKKENITPPKVTIDNILGNYGKFATISEVSNFLNRTR